MIKLGDRKKAFIASLLSFLIPIILMALVYVSLGIYPGGPNTVLIYDLRTQYISFFSYIHNLNEGFNNLMYQTSSGLGGGCFGSLAYYVGSPLSWIVCLLSERNLHVAIWIITLIKIGFSGLSFSLFLKYGNLKIKKISVLILFSVSYSLMSYNIVNTLNLMFLDGVIMLPIVILGIDRILEARDGRVLYFSVFLLTVFNYYMSFMVILFSIIWFVYRLFGKKIILSDLIRKTSYCLMFGMLGVFSAFFIILPVLFDFGRGRSNEIIYTGYGIILRNVINVMKGVLPFEYNGLLNDDSPYIYVGTIMLFLSLFFFTSKKISVRVKISSALVGLLFFISFVFTKFDSVWTAMKVANGYPARYSFCFSFFTLYLAAYFLNVYWDDNVKRKYAFPLLLLMNCIEMFFDARFLLLNLDENIGPYSLANGYEQMYNVAEMSGEIIDSNATDLCRIIKFWDYTQLDGMMYGLSSLDYYSSSYNYGLHELVGSVGAEQHLNHMTDKGMSPFLNDLFGMNYSILYYADTPRENEIYLGSADMCSIYKNENALPIAFMACGLDENTEPLSSGDPFKNQNTIAEELSGSGNIFNEIEYVIISDKYSEKDKMYIKTLALSIDELSEIWLYVEPVYIDFSGVNAADRSLLYPGVYYGEEMITEYQSALSSYCVYLGEGVGEIMLSFRSYTEIGDIHFATYNEEREEKAISILKNHSAYNCISESEGIDFDINAGDGGDMIITMPYEKGYEIYVDGKRSGYEGYRDAFITVPMDRGVHNVRLTYFTPGLKPGLLISFIAFVISIYLLTKVNNGNYDKKIK